MNVERCKYTASWRISDIWQGYLVTRTYMGYSKKEAIMAFEMEFGNEE